MRKKRHPMIPPYTSGDLFAFMIKSDMWCYCRMWRGMGIEIPPVFTREPGIPDTQWSHEKTDKWLFYFTLTGEDWNAVPVVAVGNIPFAKEENAIMPPTYMDPDIIESRYTIEYKGNYRYTNNPEDLKGIAKKITLTPSRLREFIIDQYNKGELKEVSLKSRYDGKL